MLFNMYIPIFYVKFLGFFFLNLKAKSIDFVLSSPNLILSYYPQTNHIFYKRLYLISLC